MDTTPSSTPVPAPQSVSSGAPKQTRRWMIITVGIILIVLIVALGVCLTRPATPVAGPTRPIDLPVAAPTVTSMADIAAVTQGKPVPPVFPGITLPPVNGDDHIFGDQAAPFSIVEYSNFGNVYANLLHPDLRDYVTASNGNVNWIFRHYPVATADYEPAEAAECAYSQKGHPAFWTYFDQSFALENPTHAQLVALAATQGLDQTAFEQCLTTKKMYDFVLGDVQDGELDAKVTVAPSYLVVNNATGQIRLVEGVNTIDYLKQVVAAVK